MPNLKNQQAVKILTEKFKSMKGMILMEYHGLIVEEISELRSKLRPLNSEYAVVKNTLSKIALKEAGIEAGDNFAGPTVLVIENDDIASPAKAVVDFAKNHAKLKVKAGFMEGKFVSATVVHLICHCCRGRHSEAEAGQRGLRPEQRGASGSGC